MVSIAVYEDTVYAATATTVVALDRTAGDSRWTANIRGQGPALAIGDVLVISTQQTVSFRDIETGAELGHRDTDSRQTAVALAHGCLYHVTDTAVRALDSAGEVIWRTPVDATTSPAVVGETVYVGTDSNLVALDATDGEYRFTHDLPGAKSRPVVVGNTVLCATADGALTAITGELGGSTPSDPTSLPEPESNTESNDELEKATDDSTDGSTGTDGDRSDTVATAFARGCDRIASATVVDDTGSVHVYDGRFVDAHDDVVCRIFALRLNTGGNGAAQAFQNVARQWRGISKNTHIATVVDVGETPRPWIAFDPGVSQLNDQLESLETTERVDIVADLAEAIRTAGMYNVVHGALSPDDIYLFDDEASGRTATVADWGLHRAVRRAVGEKQSLTPFTAPEQLDDGNIDSRTDIYRLGAVAHYVLTGTEPFTGATGLESAIQNSERIPPSEHIPSLSTDVDDVIATAMAHNPDQRFTSPYEFKRRLRDAMR
ncbi:PQQ-like domain-containing protein [Halorientalis regularis]|uniref:PQQ-like domain-containing protein n=1 Tax=Halorientalis regularis TaxID=660518 RepID=A0A1G7LZG3_9EURY|nr:PQQ-like domain-containing protein [Halorientalis regularis]